MKTNALIEAACSVLNVHTTPGGRVFGDVGAALVTSEGRPYTGVCIDTPSWGLCAERSAIAAMVTRGEYRIAKIVAVWKDSQSGAIHVLPPCGLCRDFIAAVDHQNLETIVILGRRKSRKLSALLPEHDWPDPID